MSIELLPTRLRVKQYPCDLGERRRIGLLGPVSGGSPQTVLKADAPSIPDLDQIGLSA